MPFDIGQSIKTVCGWGSKGSLTSALSSTLWSTVLLIIIYLIIILFTIPCKKETGFNVFFKFLTYSILASGGFMVLHDSAIKCYYDEKENSNQSDTILRNVIGKGEQQLIYDSKYKPVVADNPSLSQSASQSASHSASQSASQSASRAASQAPPKVSVNTNQPVVMSSYGTTSTLQDLPKELDNIDKISNNEPAPVIVQTPKKSNARKPSISLGNSVSF